MKWLSGSLRIKLFLMTFVLALATVVTMTLLQSRVLAGMLESSFRSSSIETSEKIGNEIDAIIQRWNLSSVYLLQGTYQLPDEQANAELQRLVDVEQNFMAGDTFMEENGSFRAVSSYHKESAAVLEGRAQKAQEWLESSLKRSSDRLFFVDISPNPSYLWLARGIPVTSDQRRRMWVVIEAKKEALVSQMRLQEGMKSFLLTDTMQDFLLGKPLEASLLKVLKQRRIEQMVQLELGSGFFGSFVDSKKVAWQGSYYLLPQSGLIFLLQQREDILYAPLKHQIVQAAKWSVLVLLFAVLLSFATSEALIARLEKVTNATESIAQGQFKTRISVKGHDEVKTLAESVNFMADRLQNLVDQEKDLVRLEHELNVANEVQSSFIPNDYQKDGALVLASSYRSASECGGDFWGHYVLAPNIHLVLVGDATGHGIPAALVTAIAYATSHLCSHLPGAAESGKMTPALVLSLLNKALYDSLKGKLCMTFFAALIDTRNGTMTYSNGGHPFPLIVPKSASDDRLKSGKRKPRPYIFLSDIKKNGQPLGFDPESVYHNVPVEFRPGDRLVMYTDGIVECYNSEQKQWGARNFEKSIQKNMELDPTEFRDTIMKDMESYRRETPLADDATLVVISSEAA